MIDIDKHEADPMISEFTERRSSGSASPLDRANAALLRADQAACIFTGSGEDCDKAQIASMCERVALAAAGCGIATRNREQGVANEFAKVAESEALTLDGYDSARLDGIQRATAFSA